MGREVFRAKYQIKYFLLGKNGIFFIRSSFMLFMKKAFLYLCVHVSNWKKVRTFMFMRMLSTSSARDWWLNVHNSEKQVYFVINFRNVVTVTTTITAFGIGKYFFGRKFASTVIHPKGSIAIVMDEAYFLQKFEEYERSDSWDQLFHVCFFDSFKCFSHFLWCSENKFGIGLSGQEAESLQRFFQHISREEPISECAAL